MFENIENARALYEKIRALKDRGLRGRGGE